MISNGSLLFILTIVKGQHRVLAKSIGSGIRVLGVHILAPPLTSSDLGNLNFPFQFPQCKMGIEIVLTS